jgi:tetratricopeptide (TPR) repeat protein
MATDDEPLRCLSVRQPFAWAICVGQKRTENRSRGTPYRGMIAIHAASSQAGVKNMVREHDLRAAPGLFPVAAIIGVAELVDVVELNESLEADPSATGPFCWRLERPRLLPSPIPSKGKLNLYSLTADESAGVRRQLVNLDPHELTPLERQWAAKLYSEYHTWVARTAGYDKLERYDDWVRCLDRAAAVDGSDPGLYRDRALARILAEKDLHLAIADLDRFLRDRPRDAEAYMMRADAYAISGDATRAEADAARAEQIEPGIRARWELPDPGDEDDAEEE